MPQTTLPKKLHTVRSGQFPGKYNAYGRPLEVAKKLHIGEPIGDTELRGRARAVKPLLEVAKSLHMRHTGRQQFREFAAPYRGR